MFCIYFISVNFQIICVVFPASTAKEDCVERNTCVSDPRLFPALYFSDSYVSMNLIDTKCRDSGKGCKGCAEYTETPSGIILDVCNFLLAMKFSRDEGTG